MPNPDAPDTTCAASPAAVTLTSLHADILATKCLTGCHEAGGTAISYGDYSTVDSSETATVNKASLYAGSAATLKVVDAETAKSTADRLANSSMWLKVSTKKPLGFKGPKMENTGAKMPNDGTTLTDAELQKIKDWICRGAPKT